jgi:hypothetical protein
LRASPSLLQAGMRVPVCDMAKVEYGASNVLPYAKIIAIAHARTSSICRLSE